MDDLGIERMRALRTLSLAAFCLASLMLASNTAAAGSLESAALNEVFQLPGQKLDDAALSGIRGRGAEGAEAKAPGDTAVIMWDELNQRRQKGQQGSVYSQSKGHGNVQGGSLVLTRY